MGSHLVTWLDSGGPLPAGGPRLAVGHVGGAVGPVGGDRHRPARNEGARSSVLHFALTLIQGGSCGHQQTFSVIGSATTLVRRVGKSVLLTNMRMYAVIYDIPR